jgi:hypothetical protein
MIFITTEFIKINEQKMKVFNKELIHDLKSLEK